MSDQQGNQDNGSDAADEAVIGVGPTEEREEPRVANKADTERVMKAFYKDGILPEGFSVKFGRGGPVVTKRGK
jgi:hypothetical protein